jgi:PAS domain S-box-containing protein
MSLDDWILVSAKAHNPTALDLPAVQAPELRLIYETAPIGLAFLTPDCRYLHINQRLTEICGIPVSGHLGRSVRETVPALADAVESIVRSIMETGEPVTGVEVAGQRPDLTGERFWITYWHPVRGPSGEIVGVNVAAEEITERKRADAALRASERQFHTLADSIPQLVWMAQADGKIFWFNSHWRAYMGLSGQETSSRDWTTTLDPASAVGAVDRWVECLKTGTTFEMELMLRASDGGYNPFLTRVVPLRDPAGGIERWIGTHVDISEQKNREEHIRFIVDELSHRTRNLLTVVMAVADQTARHASDVTQYRERFSERLKALSDCHDLLAKDQWHGATFGDLLTAQMKPFREMNDGQIDAAGPSIVLNPEAVHCLGLAFHELATNASKHGALSMPQGVVSIRWLLNEATDRIHVHWRERSGPRVVPPQRKGFGHVVIERIVPGMLKGSGKLIFAPSGVSWTFEFPAAPNADP